MREYTRKEKLILWADGFQGLTYKQKQSLLEAANEASDMRAAVTLFAEANDLTVAQAKPIFASLDKTYFDYLERGLDRRGITAVTSESESYPKELKNTACPPLALYCKGDVTLLNGKNFAIVGSRKSLPLSVNTAKTFAAAIAEAGYNLVTGIAEGVDKTVLESALSVGGKPITVVAGGFDSIYPKSHTELFEKVAERGLAVSEQTPEITPRPFHFPVRNRIIAGISRGVLVVSGGMKSGTLYTAGYAEEYGRDLFAVPYSPNVPSGAGCNDLIKRGAMLADCPEDVLSYYGEQVKKKATPLGEDEKKIAGCLKDGEMHVEKICAATGMKIFQVMPVISALEIKGIVVRNGTNFYGLARNSEE